MLKLLPEENAAWFLICVVSQLSGPDLQAYFIMCLFCGSCQYRQMPVLVILHSRQLMQVKKGCNIVLCYFTYQLKDETSPDPMVALLMRCSS